MARKPTPPDSDAKTRRSCGFEPAAGLLRDRMRKAGESRGFAVARVLTHWAEIVGADIAALAQPQKIAYGRVGMGATLTISARGASGPMLDMHLPAIREKVNACYGYNAVEKVRVTQAPARGFADPRAAFTGPPPVARPEQIEAARRVTAEVRDEALRTALEALGRNVLSRARDRKGEP